MTPREDDDEEITSDEEDAVKSDEDDTPAKAAASVKRKLKADEYPGFLAKRHKHFQQYRYYSAVILITFHN